MDKKIFYLDETPTIPGKYIIRLNHDDFFCKGTEGSYHILEARLLGLSFANYLRFCRDQAGAEIYGKGSLYPVAYFNNDAAAKGLVRMLNAYANAVLWQRENPKFDIHQLDLAKYKRENWK